jgi:hypothetical protein
VLRSKIRVGVLGLMAMLLVGSYAATPSFAVEEGPYCHHREKGGKDEGRIPESSPEEVFGTGGEQALLGKVVEVKSEIKAESVQVKGIIYNNADQCQAKLELKYHNLTMTGIKGCTPIVNGDNSVKVFAHRAWKYGGIPSELEKGLRQQKLDWIVAPTELAQGKVTSLPNGTFATITFTKHAGEACAAESVKLPVEGTVSIESHPSALEEWASLETQTVQTVGLQQYWNGTNWIEFKTGLKLGNATNPGTYVGKFSIEPTGKLKGNTPPQEIAYFEN